MYPAPWDTAEAKDSSVCADLVLTAAKRLAKSSAVKPVVIVTTGDTLVENPEITAHYRKDLKRMRLFAAKNGFKAIIRIATPALLSSWQLKLLSGRGLPSFPGMNTDCSVDLKVKPQALLRHAIFQELEELGMYEPVTIIGTRFLESDRRSANMRSRREHDVVPVRNTDGDLVLSPICDWATDDVFEYLATRQPGESYSTFEDTLRIYAHAEGQSCAIVAAAIQEGTSKARKGGCGARHGCHVCQQAQDKSLENMIEFDKRYSYAAGLNKLNKFIRNTRYDWNRRNWIGRTIKAGYVVVQPDTYHPKMVRELFRYMLQLQHDEEVRAGRLGEPVKFTLLTSEMILAVDAYWSLNGLARPYSAWADADDIQSGRVRYDIPEIEPYPVQELPAARFLYVGQEWDDAMTHGEMSGLRDAYLESLLEGSFCAPKLRTTASGRVIWDLEKESSFSVDPESLAMIEDFEVERLIKSCRTGSADAIPGSITHGYKWYLNFGVLQMSAQLAAKQDEILRRTACKDRLGLTCDYQIEAVLAKSVRFSELPDDARKAWSKKATTETAQADFFE